MTASRRAVLSTVPNVCEERRETCEFGAARVERDRECELDELVHAVATASRRRWHRADSRCDAPH